MDFVPKISNFKEDSKITPVCRGERSRSRSRHRSRSDSPKNNLHSFKETFPKHQDYGNSKNYVARVSHSDDHKLEINSRFGNVLYNYNNGCSSSGLQEMTAAHHTTGDSCSISTKSSTNKSDTNSKLERSICSIPQDVIPIKQKSCLEVISKIKFDKPGSISKAGIKMKIASVTPKKESCKKLTVASAFNIDSDEDVEEMPAECKMRMRNIGRDTPTSSGPNTFGKTKQGFIDSRKVFEKSLRQTMD